MIVLFAYIIIAVALLTLCAADDGKAIFTLILTLSAFLCFLYIIGSYHQSTLTLNTYRF